ncbi:MAG: TetR family transcriptional regulator [Rhizobiales bacterium]|nr:TetR family transcriptional regulator [Hyphomicrobiales bacterium]
MDTRTSGAKRAPRERSRTNDPDRTKADIIAVATEEFAAYGLSGARVDAIAERTRTSKRMIYYYFGGKEGLYLAVLEKAYADIRDIEQGLKLDVLDPVEALRRLIDQTFEYDDSHADFVRIVAIENIHQAKHLAEAPSIRQINLRVIELVGAILARGRDQGLFRADLDAVDVHMMISAFCFFRVANRHTFGEIFQVDLSEPGLRAKHKRMIAEAVLRLVRQEEPAGGAAGG